MHIRIAALITIILSLAMSAAAGIPGIGGFRVLFEADSIYHHIVVAEDTTARYLRFDRSYQSGMYLHDTFDSPVPLCRLCAPRADLPASA